MKELIKIESKTIGDQCIKSVSARELYLGLGLAKQHWKRWSKENIENNEFFVEGADYKRFPIMVNGNQVIDFAISLEFAKHIAMQARTTRSHDYRNYMIECEKAAPIQCVPQLPDFTNPVIAARAWANEVEAKQALEHKVQEDAPKVEFYERVGDASGLQNMTQAAQALGIGRNKLFEKLREEGIFQQGKTYPYTQFINRGYFVVKEKESNGHLYTQTFVTPRGIQYLAARFSTIHLLNGL